MDSGYYNKVYTNEKGIATHAGGNASRNYKTTPRMSVRPGNHLLSWRPGGASPTKKMMK